MFNVGGGEILVILVVALVVLGPDKLPDAMRTIGQMIGEVRKLSNGFQSEMRNAMYTEDRPTIGPIVGGTTNSPTAAPEPQPPPESAPEPAPPAPDDASDPRLAE